MGDYGLADPHYLSSRPSAEPRPTLGSEAAGDAAGLYRAASTRLGFQRQPARRCVLYALSDDERWDAFESGLNQRLLRVYNLSTEPVRLGSTTVSGYWRVTPDGLFQLGHSKGGRPDLPQVKVMLATLDPLGMPAATDVLSGNPADDPLYIPSITRVRESLGRSGLLYVGDCKMAALETRAFVQAGGDFYLCPLSETQLEHLHQTLRQFFQTALKMSEP